MLSKHLDDSINQMECRIWPVTNMINALNGYLYLRFSFEQKTKLKQSSKKFHSVNLRFISFVHGEKFFHFTAEKLYCACILPLVRISSGRFTNAIQEKKKKQQKIHRYFFFFSYNLFHINLTHFLHMSCCDRMNDENEIFAFKSFYDLFVLWIPCSFLYRSLVGYFFFSFCYFISCFNFLRSENAITYRKVDGFGIMRCSTI